MNILLHAGFPKCASSFLQQIFFERHPGIQYLGSYFGDGKRVVYEDGFHSLFYNRHMAEIDLAIAIEDGIEFNIDAMKKSFQNDVLPHFIDTKPLVYSSEMLSLAPHLGRDVLAERVHAIFGKCKVLFIIRNQFNALLSAYKDDCRSRSLAYSEFPTTFSEWRKLNKGVPFRKLKGRFDYFDQIACYQKLFGAENVHVLMYEDLNQNTEKFLRSLCAIVGVPFYEEMLEWADEKVHSAPDRALLESNLIFNAHRFLRPWLRRLPEAFFRHFIFRRGMAADYQEQLSEEDRAHLTDIYRAGNRELTSSFALPLQEHGYPL